MGGVLSDRQSAFHAPVSQPRPILRMQPGANVDADARVGVAVGMVVDVGVAIGVDSSAVAGVFVGVGVWVGVGVGDAPSSASNLLVSAVIRYCKASMSPCCLSSCASILRSSRLILSSAPSGVDTPVAVSVGVSVGAGSPVTDVLVGVSVGSAVAETLVDVGVSVGGGV